MIISPSRNFIFVHIPKTGGTALSLALEGRARADDILIGDTPKAVRRRQRVKKLSGSGRLWKHSKLSDIEGVIERGTFQTMFLCCLVRNPWDRLVSYYHWLQLQNWEHVAVRLAKTQTFSGFLNAPEVQRSLRENYADYMRDGAGQPQQAHFMRLERLDEDLVPLWEHLGFNLSPIGRVNASMRERDFRGYYSDADMELVGKVLATDIAQFDYKFTKTGL